MQQEGKTTPREDKRISSNEKRTAPHTFFCTGCGRSFRTAVHLRVHSASHKKQSLVAKSLSNNRFTDMHSNSGKNIVNSNSSTSTTSNKNNTNNNPEACIICCDRLSCIIIDPCQHSEMCWQCASQLATCPLCRANIVSISYQSGEYVQNSEQNKETELDQPPRPPRLTGNDRQDKEAMQQWVAAANDWQERHQESNEIQNAEINSLYSEMERWTKETSEWYEATSKWQCELNDWWEAMAANNEQSFGSRWYRMWDHAAETYYYWNEYSNETTWNEPTEGYIDYIHNVTDSSGSENACMMGSAMVALLVIQCAVRRWLSKRRHQKLQIKKLRSFNKILAMGKMKKK
jgi:hypothetical protein